MAFVPAHGWLAVSSARRRSADLILSTSRSSAAMIDKPLAANVQLLTAVPETARFRQAPEPLCATAEKLARPPDRREAVGFVPSLLLMLTERAPGVPRGAQAGQEPETSLPARGGWALSYLTTSSGMATVSSIAANRTDRLLSALARPERKASGRPAASSGADERSCAPW